MMGEWSESRKGLGLGERVQKTRSGGALSCSFLVLRDHGRRELPRWLSHQEFGREAEPAEGLLRDLDSHPGRATCPLNKPCL